MLPTVVIIITIICIIIIINAIGIITAIIIIYILSEVKFISASIRAVSKLSCLVLSFFVFVSESLSTCQLFVGCIIICVAIIVISIVTFCYWYRYCYYSVEVFSGIGYGQCLGSTCVATYYCTLIAISFFYFIKSFTSNLPWLYCRDEWDYENSIQNITCVEANGNTSGNGGNMMSSSELYFRYDLQRACL